MKSKDIIRLAREDMEELNQLHLKWVETDGKEGCQCFNYDTFLKKYNRTDAEIVKEAAESGIYVSDYDEFFGIKKES